MIRKIKYLIPVVAGVFGLSQFAAAHSVELKTRVDRPLIVKNGGEQKVIIKIDVAGLPIEKKLTRMPLNIALVLDRSGSMTGKKLEQAKQAAEMLVDQLGANDVFSLVMYDSDVDVLIEAQKVGNKRSTFKRAIRNIQAGGSTALYHGVETGGKQLAEYFDNEKINRVILLSDGIANIGPSSNREISKLGQTLAKRQISVSTVGLGDNYNEDLMTSLAEASDANYYYVADVEELPNVFEKELGELQSIVARQIIVEIICPKGVTPIRFYGRGEAFENRRGSVKFGTLAGDQSRELILEAMIDPSVFEAGAPMADVVMTFDDALKNRSAQSMKREVVIGYTDDKSLSEKTRDQDIVAAAAIYWNVDESKKALALADSGDVAKCRTQIFSQIGNLKKAKEAAPAAWADAIQEEITVLEKTESTLDESRGLEKAGRKSFQNRIYSQSNSKKAVK